MKTNISRVGTTGPGSLTPIVYIDYLFTPMFSRFILAFLLLGSMLVAQEPNPMPQPPVPRPEAAMRGMNPAMLLRMRDRMTFELQQTQRTLGFVDPNDTQLLKTLNDQQAELLHQLKEVNAQLKTAGITGQEDDVAAPKPPVPAIPSTDTPPVLGGTSQPAADGMLIQQRPAQGDEIVGVPPRNPLPNGMMGGMVPGQTSPYTPMQSPPNPLPNGMMGGFVPPGGIPGGMLPNGPPGFQGPPAIPQSPQQSAAEFDQDQAFANSPWAPKPSKELTELKQTVDALRKELGEMRETVKALEAQIQLLNRNILLSQPAAGK